MIKAAIFDFDGTLMNTLPGISHFCNIALNSVGLESIKEIEKFAYFVGDGRDSLIHRILNYFSADTEENFKKAGLRYDEEYKKDILYESVVYPGIYELLEKLRNNGIKLAVLSNKPNDVATVIIEKTFPNYFDIYSGQKKAIPKKPAPEAALNIAKSFEVSVSECIFIGDTMVDIETGKNAGMQTIGVLWGFRKKEELESADALASVPSDILKIIQKLNN